MTELERARVGEISPFLTRLSCHVSTEKMVTYHLGRGTFPDTPSADNLILSFSPLELTEIIFCCLLLTYFKVFWYSSLKRLKFYS